MNLREYTTKRDFTQTPEPKGDLAKSKETPPIFVVQKHWATTLHYDLRLEIDGVLKSWAVPKEPSLDPSIKRLAIMTEDHPLEYQNFEGEIPAGNYGAGKVEIWDKGNFMPASGDLSDMPSKLSEGHLSVVLNGKKLMGEFALVRLKNKSKHNNWLLIKAEDEYAR